MKLILCLFKQAALGFWKKFSTQDRKFQEPEDLRK